MASAQQKPKSGQKNFNTDRKNRKAWKQSGSSRVRKGPVLSEVQKVLMGRGMLVNTARRVEVSP